MDPESFGATLQIINTFGVTAVLYIFLRLFITGAILPRSVYDDITGKIVSDIGTRILDGTKQLVDEAVSRDER